MTDDAAALDRYDKRQLTNFTAIEAAVIKAKKNLQGLRGVTGLAKPGQLLVPRKTMETPSRCSERRPWRFW